MRNKKNLPEQIQCKLAGRRSAAAYDTRPSLPASPHAAFLFNVCTASKRRLYLKDYVVSIDRRAPPLHRVHTRPSWKRHSTSTGPVKRREASYAANVRYCGILYVSCTCGESINQFITHVLVVTPCGLFTTWFRSR